MKNIYRKIKKRYNTGVNYLNNSHHIEIEKKTNIEMNKTPYRYDIINYILNYLNKETKYLEIGVRFPDENFNKINSKYKYSVDPGLENKINPVDFKITSDEFFESLNKGKILNKEIKFDVIFIDGLHFADQVNRDIENSLKFLSEEGFVVLHDCNPPTMFHASEVHEYKLSPSKGYWNGTTWKAFFNFRKRNDYYSCCIDTDWGVGIITRKVNLGKNTNVINPFYEFNVFDKYRKNSLNLMTFDEFKNRIKQHNLSH